MNRIRNAVFSRSRLLLCLLFAVLTVAGLTGSTRCEAVIQTINSSGNQNIQPAVDPIENSEGYSAVLYDNRNGLPTSEANAIAQTDEGFIWIGSYAGLIRYDGNSFEIIESPEGILNTRCLYVDSRNRLWIGTNDFGVFVMTRGQLKRVDREDQLVSISIRALAEDPEGVIYVATAAGIATVDTEMNLTVLEDDRISGETIQDIRLGSDGLIYGVTQTGDLFTMKGGKILAFADHETCRTEPVLAILPDPVKPGSFYYSTQKSNRVYYGTLENNVIMTGSDRDASPLSSVDRMEYINGQIWICAGNGIGKLSDEGLQQLRNIPMDKLIGHVMTDYEGNLWFTSTRQCVMKIVPNRFQDLFDRYNMTAEVVNSTCIYGKQMFLGTDSGLIVLEDGKKLDSIPLTRAVTASGKKIETTDLISFLNRVRIRSIIRDSKGRLWISTWSQYGLLRYDGTELMAFTMDDGLISEPVRTVSECEDGSVLAAQPDGISIIRDDSVISRYGAGEGLVVTAILTVTEGFNHEMILGSDGGGIYIYGPDGMKHIGIKDGLKSEVILRIKRSAYRDIYWIATGNSIAYMTPDYRVTTIDHFPYSNNYDFYENSQGDIWVLSSNGIYVVRAEELLANEQVDAVFYGIPSGLPYIATSNSFSELTDEGDLYIAGVKGAIHVNIEQPFDNLSEVKVALPFIDVDGQRIYPDESGEYTVSYNARKMTIYPYVFNYSLNDPQVSYRLEGFDTEDTTVSRSKMTPVDYTNLKIGAYHFVIKTKDPVGRSEKTVLFRIVKGRELPATTIGTLIMAFASLILLTGILIHTYPHWKGIRNRLQDRLFVSLILINAALAIGEVLSYMLEYVNVTAVREIMITANTIVYLALVSFPYLLLVYLDYCSDPDKVRVRKMKLLYGIPCFLFFIVAALNLKTGWLFTISEGNAYISGLHDGLVLVPIAPILFYFLFSLIRMARLNKRLAALGILLIVIRFAWDLWFANVSSTTFIYTMFLMCIHLHVINMPLYEEGL